MSASFGNVFSTKNLCDKYHSVKNKEVANGI